MKVVEVPDIGTVRFYRHSKAKSIRLRVKTDKSVRVTLPRFCTFGYARSFVREQQAWIESQRAKIVTPVLDKPSLESVREQARSYIVPRVAEFAAKEGFEYGTIRIKNMSSRWGSCSTKKNLNFSLYLMRLGQKYIDYVIWHELCHTEHMNHGKEFWDRLEQVCPGAKIIDKEMRKFPMV